MTPRSWSTTERASAIAADSDRALSKLELVSRHEGPTPACARFLLQQPESSAYWAEVVTLRGGSVLVHGDVETVVFSRCSYTTWRQRLVWMAHADTRYAQQKASIGGTRNAYEFDRGVARNAIPWYRRQEYFSRETARKLWDHVEDDTPEEFARRIYEATGDAELCDIGQCIGSHVLMAQAVLRKLLTLLPAETQPEAACLRP